MGFRAAAGEAEGLVWAPVCGGRVISTAIKINSDSAPLHMVVPFGDDSKLATIAVFREAGHIARTEPIDKVCRVEGTHCGTHCVEGTHSGWHGCSLRQSAGAQVGLH